MDMLRLALIQRFLPSRSPGGVGHFTHGLGNALVTRGHAVTVFSQDPAPDDALYRVVAVPGTANGTACRSAALRFPFQAARQDLSGFDVIHAQGDDHLIPRWATPPVVRTMHGSALAEAVHNGWRQASAKRLALHLYFYGCELIAAARADAVVAVSEDTRRYYPRVDAVIPNGVDIERFWRQANEKTPAPTVLFVGQLDSRKRGRLLVDVVCNGVRPYLPDAELWLVCPEKVERAGVRWFGRVDADKLAELYRQAWVVCLPSSYEGFGRPYIEAMAAGTPVVATPNAGAREVLENGRYGLMVPDAQLAETLRAVLSQEDMRRRYSGLGAERVKTYAWTRVAEQYEEVYHAVRLRRGAHAERVTESSLNAGTRKSLRKNLGSRCALGGLCTSNS